MMNTKQTRYEIEAILVKAAARHKIGSNEDIDPDLDATYFVGYRKTEEEARACGEEMFAEHESYLMWNCVTVQKEVFGDDGMPIWEAVGETQSYDGDKWN